MREKPFQLLIISLGTKRRISAAVFVESNHASKIMNLPSRTFQEGKMYQFHLLPPLLVVLSRIDTNLRRYQSLPSYHASLQDFSVQVNNIHKGSFVYHFIKEFEQKFYMTVLLWRIICKLIDKMSNTRFSQDINL